ncbi:MAG: type II toxin-antitoxin system RelE/ParE family toxin [Candidatus Omnitrophica bacterium]|nr:type II toxin-antitoxin system RelE/ParE family toxin [Candidatus Omnitrophota bacterium]
MTLHSEYEVIFYKKENEECPTDEFLDSLSSKVRAKLQKWIEQLEIWGPSLPRPYADTIRDKIRELRVKFGGANYRFLYFFAGKMIVITHGFVKKTDRVPGEEVERAIRFMNDFQERLKRGEFEL